MEIIITTIIWAAVIQGLLLGVMFIISRKHRSFANTLLGFFLLCFVFVALTDLLPFDEIGSYSLYGYFRLPEVKLFFPVLFLHFVLKKLGRTTSYQPYIKIQYGLAGVIASLTLVNVLLFLFANLSLSDLIGYEFLDRFYMGQQYYAFILTVIAFVIALRETWMYRNMVRNEFTDLTMMDINWLWQFIFVLAPIILFWGAELTRIVLGGRGQSELTTAVYIFIAFFNYFVSYKAFTQQTLFEGSPDSSKSLETEPIIPDKSNTIVDHDVCEQITDEMEAKQYYLNQNLTIHDFAKEIHMPARTISTCVNQSVGNNFNEWVNNYRVDKAVALLTDQNTYHLSIEGIGIDSGFRSRSAMYAAFQKKLGKSPGHFR
jgi:AraC-like DNA-binding protein